MKSSVMDKKAYVQAYGEIIMRATSEETMAMWAKFEKLLDVSKLPPLDPVIRSQAQAYLEHMLEQEPPEELVYVCGRFAELREKQPAFLQDLAGMAVADDATTKMRATLQKFHGTVCPGCGGEKRGGDDGHWFCNRNCWPRLPGTLRTRLRFGFRVVDLPAYFEALSFLQREVVCVQK